MCGFLVVFSKKENILQYKKLFNQSLELLHHRGPDSTKFYIDKNCYIGFKRLRILDLNSRSDQPMVSQNGRFILVFNGEIYNFKELKKELKKENCKFHTSSDTEVILKGYELYSSNIFSRLIGMWSIIIYDKKKKKLIISRDRIGIKQLYYSKYNDNFIFSNEIKSIKELIEKKHNKKIGLNYNFIKRFLINANHQTKFETFFAGINEIEPSKIYELKNEIKFVKSIWSFPKSNSEKPDLNHLENLIDNVISDHFVSDVPIASTLSGGIDSSIISLLLNNKLINQKKKSFSLKFNKFDNDETSLILETVKKENINHEFIEIKEKDLSAELDEYINFLDEPTYSDNQLYQYILKKNIAKQNYKVLLTGEGADEVFCGYKKFEVPYLASFFCERKIKDFYNGVDLISKKNLQSKFKTILNILKFLFFSYGKRDKQLCLLGMKFLKKKVNYNNLFASLDSKFFNKRQIKINNFLREEMIKRFLIDIPKSLKEEDVTGMAHSLEIRVPYLDHRLIDYVSRLDYKYLYLNGNNKYLLRESMKKSIPKHIHEVKKKFHRPGNIRHFVYNILKENILDQLNSKNLFLHDFWSGNLEKQYFKDSKEFNFNNAYPWFRFYQINRLIELKYN